MANPTCRNCDRNADAGAYYSSCAAGIMASALNHRSWPAQETSSRTTDTFTATRVHVRRHTRPAPPFPAVWSLRYAV